MKDTEIINVWVHDLQVIVYSTCPIGWDLELFRFFVMF